VYVGLVLVIVSGSVADVFTLKILLHDVHLILKMLANPFLDSSYESRKDRTFLQR